MCTACDMSAATCLCAQYSKPRPVRDMLRLLAVASRRCHCEPAFGNQCPPPVFGHGDRSSVHHAFVLAQGYGSRHNNAHPVCRLRRVVRGRLCRLVLPVACHDARCHGGQVSWAWSQAHRVGRGHAATVEWRAECVQVQHRAARTIIASIVWASGQADVGANSTHVPLLPLLPPSRCL